LTPAEDAGCRLYKIHAVKQGKIECQSEEVEWPNIASEWFPRLFFYLLILDTLCNQE
jgi:hypothetical protein